MRNAALKVGIVLIWLVACNSLYSQKTDVRPLFILASDDLSEFWRELPLDLVRESEPFKKYLSIIEDPQWNLIANSNEKRSGFEWWVDWIDKTKPTVLRAKGYSSGPSRDITWYAAIKFEAISSAEFSTAIRNWRADPMNNNNTLGHQDEKQKPKVDSVRTNEEQGFREFEVDGQVFYDFGSDSSVLWTVDEDWVCIVSHDKAFKQFRRDLESDGMVQEGNRSLFRVLSAVTRPDLFKINKGKLVFAADFEAFGPIMKSVLPEDAIRSLGVNEIVGGGVGVDIIRKSKPPRIQIDAIVLTTLPKSGVAKLLDSLEPIDSLPPIPEHSFFLSAINVSPLEAYDGCVELYESIQGKGSFLRDLDAIPGGRPDFHLRDELFSGIGGAMLSVNILDPGMAVPQRVDAFEVESVEKVKKVVQSLVEFDALHAREQAKVATVLNGYPAWFSEESKFKEFADILSAENVGPPPLNSGYVLTDQWAYYSDKAILESLLSQSIVPSSGRNSELQREMERFEKEIGISPEFIIVAWPEFLRVLTGRQIFRDLDRLYPEQSTRNRIVMGVTQGVDYPVPETREQAAYWAKINLQKALTSLVSRIMLAGQSNGEGLRAQLRIELGSDETAARRDNR